MMCRESQRDDGLAVSANFYTAAGAASPVIRLPSIDGQPRLQYSHDKHFHRRHDQSGHPSCRCHSYLSIPGRSGYARHDRLG